MPELLHSAVPPNENHAIIAWVVATAQDLVALPVMASDVHKVAFVPPAAYYSLASHSPTHWVLLSSPPATAPATIEQFRRFSNHTTSALGPVLLEEGGLIGNTIFTWNPIRIELDVYYQEDVTLEDLVLPITDLTFRVSGGSFDQFPNFGFNEESAAVYTIPVPEPFGFNKIIGRSFTRAIAIPYQAHELDSGDPRRVRFEFTAYTRFPLPNQQVNRVALSGDFSVLNQFGTIDYAYGTAQYPWMNGGTATRAHFFKGDAAADFASGQIVWT